MPEVTQLQAYVARVVAEAPSLSDSQRERLGALLHFRHQSDEGERFSLDDVVSELSIDEAADVLAEMRGAG